ncbi:MAG: V-type ATPase subunit [Actinomycetota bacterium]|nr:V-type ATPase subunit [Actinomycetota bacterium]
MRVISDPIRYGFATGRVRVLETRLLSRSAFERLLDAPDFQAQKRVLSDTPYGGYIENVTTADGVEHALDEAMADMYADFLERANLPESLIEFFRAQHEYANLRAALKSETLGIPAQGLADPLALTPVEAFETGGGLSAEMAKALTAARKMASTNRETLDPDSIDPAVDTVYYARLGELADESDSKFLRGLAGSMADLGNVKAFLRARQKELPVAVAERYFVSGGSMKREWFISLYRIPVADAAVEIARQRMFSGVGSDTLLDPSRFDIVAEKILARVLREARMVAIGPEPVVAYAMARRGESSALRALLIGKMAGADTDVLRERLRDVV